ncbi:hypothetical protein NWI01_14270 [Nitrobacter winogradskyi]|uniref:Uncharacterized protein n=1 Tax=Nitrobacter winogradskyi TaxID=913 RepID=A0A4Y3WAA9_NITWI|nr:hypothetical protein NWI01_14270 [Nitrobacter winogradskyi]
MPLVPQQALSIWWLRQGKDAQGKDIQGKDTGLHPSTRPTGSRDNRLKTVGRDDIQQPALPAPTA